MATKEKSKEAPKPFETIKEGAVLASIWQKSAKDGSTYFTLTVGRLYKDEADKWRTGGGLYPRDAENTGKALAKAFERIEQLEAAARAQAAASAVPENNRDKARGKTKAVKPYYNRIENFVPTGWEDY